MFVHFYGRFLEKTALFSKNRYYFWIISNLDLTFYQTGSLNRSIGSDSGVLACRVLEKTHILCV